MPSLSFNTKNNYPYLFLVALFCFCTLTACVAQQRKIENSYYCDLTKLTICDKKNQTSCTEISATDIIEPPHTIFYPETLSAHSYEGSELIEKLDINLWHTLDRTIFMAGYGSNVEGNATVWSGSIDGESGDLIVSAFSLDYSYLLLGDCQVR